MQLTLTDREIDIIMFSLTGEEQSADSKTDAEEIKRLKKKIREQIKRQ